MQNRPNWIEIHLDALRNNIQLFRKKLPQSTKILLPVKADAYGHGSLACSWAAFHSGVDWLGVAHVFEGVLLRQYGIPLPILVLGTSTPQDFESIVRYQLTPSLSDASHVEQFSKWLATQNMQYPAHLKVDTGMHRFGIPAEDFAQIEALISDSFVQFEGLFSHLSTADEPHHPMTQKQEQKFADLVFFLKSKGKCPPLCHLANSAGVLGEVGTHYNMVRPGIALYGYNPFGPFDASWGLEPMLQMRATVRQIHDIGPGESVSYGLRWTATQNSRIATVAIGYGDGYMRGEVNQGYFSVKGKLCPIVGRVCMDATMIDISAAPEVQIGDVVEVIHGKLSGHLSLETIASRSHTISYEMATRVARRLYRLYWWNGIRMRWDELREVLGIPDFEDQTK